MAWLAELAYTEAALNNFNSWETDTWSAGTSDTATDLIGSNDDGYGGYIMPSFTIDKLTLALNLGFTADGYQPDRAFGSGVMIGSADNSRISAIRIGDFGDWLWAGLIAQYQVNEALKLTGNFIYADIDAWDTKGVEGDGPKTTSGSIRLQTIRLPAESVASQVHGNFPVFSSTPSARVWMCIFPLVTCSLIPNLAYKMMEYLVH